MVWIFTELPLLLKVYTGFIENEIYTQFLKVVYINNILKIGLFVPYVKAESIFVNIDWYLIYLFLIINIIVIIVPVLVSVAFLTLLERKIMAAIQRRRGPNIIGFFGLLQPFADGLKLLTKEFNIPARSFDFLVVITPMMSLMFTCSCFSLVPLSYSYIYFTTNSVSALFVMAISSLNIYSIIMAGWASKSAYAFLGSLRASAQFISYEVSLTLNIMAVFLLSGSFELSEILYMQEESIPNVLVLFPVFILYFVGIISETNRTPFDLAEAESELVAGYGVEFSAVGFAYFFIAEYGSIILYCLLTLVFFGGGIVEIFVMVIHFMVNLPWLFGYILYLLSNITALHYLSSWMLFTVSNDLLNMVTDLYEIWKNQGLFYSENSQVIAENVKKHINTPTEEHLLLCREVSISFFSKINYVKAVLEDMSVFYIFFEIENINNLHFFYTGFPYNYKYQIPYEHSYFGVLLESIFFGLQVVFILIFFCYIRATYARFRFDQLMKLNWKNLLLISLALDLYIAIILKLVDLIDYHTLYFIVFYEIPFGLESIFATYFM